MNQSAENVIEVAHETTKKDQDHHQRSRTAFAVTLLILQALVLYLYGMYVRVASSVDQDSFQTGYPFYQDVNVMMLIGFGFLMTFIKTHQWSALAYTFFINAIVVQYYLLLQPFWHKVMHGGWASPIITINIQSFTAASYSVASILIAFGAVLGRVGALQLLVMAIIGLIGYTLNEDIVYGQFKLFDAGGSTAIHTYGAYFGLTVSALISKIKRPNKEPQSSQFSNTIATFGTFFLWMFWPSFNAGYFPTTPFQRTLIVTNTICSLVGSCMSAFVISALVRNKFSMEDILNATLAGGVAIGAPSGLITNPAGCLAIGVISGTISTLGFARLSPKLHSFLGLDDTCGVNNLHGIPGLLGGIFSAIAVAVYNISPLAFRYEDYVPFSLTKNIGRTYTQQAGYQIAGTASSLGIGILFGFITGLILVCFYKFQERQFYNDSIHFDMPSHEQQELKNQQLVTF